MKPNLKAIGSKLVVFFLLPVFTYGVFACIRPEVFLSASLLLTLLNQSINLVVLAWGMSFGMMIGNMDLSCCAEQILGTMVAVLLSRVLGVWGLVLGVALTALVVGGIKAFLLATINMKSMVISIAYTLILGSIGYLMTGGEAILLTDARLTILGDYPWSLLIFLVSGFVMYFLHRYSLFGAQCIALSGNETIALSNGIKKKRVESMAIIVCSAYVAISGLLAVSRGAGATPLSGLNSLTNVFSAMSGVFIAMALSKYISMPIGIFVGVYSMNIITVGLLACNMNSQLKTTVNGAFLILIMLFIEFQSRYEREKDHRAAAASRKTAAC